MRMPGGADDDGERIGCVVVVYPEVAFRLQRERHAAVLRKGMVHLCMHPRGLYA
jgi:hypothetical protein